MLGAIIGDIVGSVYEVANTKSENFPLFTRFSRFTDDTVLTIAIADALLHRKQHPVALIEAHFNKILYARKLKEYGRRFPNAGYGQLFSDWIGHDSKRGYRSFGNGSAMRVSPIGFAFDWLDDVLREARLSAIVTHNHPEGIKGAQAIACAVFLARTGTSKQEMRVLLEKHFHYNLHQTLEEIRLTCVFDSSCQGSVPQAIIAFLESSSFEDALRKAVSLGGDSDTIACMAGAIAQAYYQKIPAEITTQASLLIDWSFKTIIDAFNQMYSLSVTNA